MCMIYTSYLYVYIYIYAHLGSYIQSCSTLRSVFLEPTNPTRCLGSRRMIDSTENATPQKSTESRISNSSVQIQIKLNYQFECVPRDTEESKYLDWVDFGDVAF